MPRHITVKIPAIETEVAFSRMQGQDEISQPFSYSLEITSFEMEVDPLKVLGTRATIVIEGDSERFFDGIIADMSLKEIRDDLAFYRLTLRPALWVMSLDTDNRIFQEKSAPDIIKEVLNSWPDVKFDMKLQGKYETREYCVQYGESDLDFIQRLMEDEGLFYYFDHSEEGHKLLIVDSNSAMGPSEGGETVPYEPDSRLAYDKGDFVFEWTPKARLRTGKFSQTDYDFKKPALDMMTKNDTSSDYAAASTEHYHYPGRYLELAAGDAIAKRRLEELQADQRRISARATARHLRPGKSFKFELFPIDRENSEYFVVSAHYEMWDEQRRAGQAEQGQGYEVRLELSPIEQTYRPPRRTRKPRMQGPQTAKVVGPAGAEIHCDEFSRVKVHFFWDRLDHSDENSSCFIRVSAAWAGAGWGFIQIPRIGHEVIVDFLEGDPDQPIITGRVYHAQNTVPYELPGKASQSGWKSWSTPETGGYNELRFEDKAGAEEVYFQAEKDHNELVKNDETRTIGHDWVEDVGHDATQSIGHDRTESVANNKDVSVGNNRTVAIGVNDDETVGSNRSLTVGANEVISVGANSSETIGSNHSQTVALTQTVTIGTARTDTVGAAEVRSVGANQSNTIGNNRSVTVGSSQTHSIGSNDGWSVGGGQSVSVGKDQAMTIAGAMTVKVGKDQTTEIGGAQATKVGKKALHQIGEDLAILAGKNITIEAADSITLKTGKASIIMKKDGTIMIEGKDVTVKGSGKINVKASSDVIVKGSTIKNN